MVSMAEEGREDGSMSQVNETSDAVDLLVGFETVNQERSRGGTGVDLRPKTSRASLMGLMRADEATSAVKRPGADG